MEAGIVETTGTLWTVTRIAAHLKVPRHRVEYVIEDRGLRPVARAGIARVFDPADVERIAREIRRIDAERGEVRLDD
jgi:hypothetical protein